MLVQDYMTSPAITIAVSALWKDASLTMRQHSIRHLPVVNLDGRLVGIISERDILKTTPAPATEAMWELTYLLERYQVGDMMSKTVITVTPQSTIQEAGRLMVEHKIGALPVVDETGNVVGMISEIDLLNLLLDMVGRD